MGFSQGYVTKCLKDFIMHICKHRVNRGACAVFFLLLAVTDSVACRQDRKLWKDLPKKTNVLNVG
jgi:hypothetical protein